MNRSAALVQGVKARLKAQGISYRELAGRLGVSEPTIKRDLAGGNFTLQRLDRICDVLGCGVSDLVLATENSPITELTEHQEQALTSDPKLLLVTYLVVNDWKFAQIVATFRLEANDLVNVLLKLDDLRILDFRPPARVRKLTARSFSWRKDGAVQEYFLRRVIPEFLTARFELPGDEFRFVAGLLSPASMLRLQQSVRRVAAEFDQLAHQDSHLPLEERNACSGFFAFRQWEFSEFSKLRRMPKSMRGR